MSEKKKYIYSLPMCSGCIALKAKYDKAAIRYEERDGARLQGKWDTYDEVDVEAFTVYNMQNMAFPVEVNIET